MRIADIEITGIEPMGAVRMTRRGKFTDKYAQKYLQYKELIYYSVLKQLAPGFEPIDAAIAMNINFYMPIPKSFPKYAKETAPGKWCTTKPDVDNLVKGLLDALNGLLWVDDNRIVAVNVNKVYSNEPGIDFTFDEVGGLSHGQKRGQETKAKQSTKRKTESRAGRTIRARL